MIYNTKNRSNGTTESQKGKKTCFNAHFQRDRNTNSPWFRVRVCVRVRVGAIFQGAIFCVPIF